MRNILAATLMIMGAIFISAYSVCHVIVTNYAGGGDLNEKFLLLIGGLIAIVAGVVLFALESNNKQ